MSRPTLLVALDLRDPFAYLALAPTCELADSTGLRVDWRPFQGHVLRPPGPPRSDDDRGTRHRQLRAQAIAREIAVYAEAQGLQLRDPYRDAPVDLVNQAWLWLREHDPERLRPWMEALFRAYWSLELDVLSREAIGALLHQAGADADAFLSIPANARGEALRRHQTELEVLGLFQSPGYALEDEVFHGRQHLPMLRWILSGRSGPVPI